MNNLDGWLPTPSVIRQKLCKNYALIFIIVYAQVHFYKMKKTLIMQNLYKMMGAASMFMREVQNSSRNIFFLLFSTIIRGKWWKVDGIIIWVSG